MELKKIERIDSKFIEMVYVESEFIDSVEEIIARIKDKKNDSQSIPFVVLSGDEIVSFFTIESSHPGIDATKEIDSVYWMESFFITKNYIGKVIQYPC